jgi:RecB family exonuclease
VRVVDFKTGRTPRPKAAVEEDPQLAVYQIAVREGGFAHLPFVGDRARTGGGELVFLRTSTSAGLPVVRTQGALPADGPSWADDLLGRTAKGVRAEQFPARSNDGCDVCAYRGLCPAQDAGDQVVR